MQEENVKKIVKFTQELVRILSQNGIDSEKDMANLIFKRFKKIGFVPKVIGEKEHPSVICFLKKPGAKKTIWLESHLDTVPAGNFKRWKFPPFESKIEGNKMYGRGVADSKIDSNFFIFS